MIRLELADNGIGMPQINLDDELVSLGLRLMKGLSEILMPKSILKLATELRSVLYLMLTC